MTSTRRTRLRHAAIAAVLLSGYGCSALFGLDDMAVTTAGGAEDPCATCMFTQCSSELTACQAEPDCADYLACLETSAQACTDGTCVIETCGAPSETGFELGVCICDYCSDSCDYCASGAGGSGGSGTAGSGGIGGAGGAGSAGGAGNAGGSGGTVASGGAGGAAGSGG